MSRPALRAAALAAVFALWAALAAGYLVQLGGEAHDDFFITYRYAQNLAAGRGLVFNPGERVFGTTAPGMALLLAGAHLVTRVPIHWLGSLSTAAALLALALLLAQAALRAGRLPEALAGGTLLFASTFVWTLHGAEVHLVLAALALAAALAGSRPGAAGAVAGLAVWLRPDAVVGGALLGLLLLAERRRPPWRFALAAAAVAGVGLALAWTWFGEPVPATWAAKRAAEEGFAAGGGRLLAPAFWGGAEPLLGRHLGALWPAIVALGGLGLVPLALRAGRPGRLLAANAVALALLYPLLGVRFAAWYAVPVAVALLYGLPFAVGELARRAGRAVEGLGAGRLTAALVAVLLAAPLALSAVPAGVSWVRRAGSPLHHTGYREAGEWIAGRSAPGDAIAFVEIGTLAYFSDRPIVDLMGLVTPVAIPYVRRGDLVGAFRARPARFIVVRPGLAGYMGQITARPWFARRYRRVWTWRPRSADWLAVYELRPGA